MNTQGMPQVDRAAAGQAAIAARRARAQLKEQLRSGELQPEQVLAQSAQPETVASGLRVTDFLLCLHAIGRTKMVKILDQLDISEKKRLGGLGIHQRERLEAFLRHRKGE